MRYFMICYDIWYFQILWDISMEAQYLIVSNFMRYFIRISMSLYGKITPPIYHSLQSSHVQWPMSQLATCDQRCVTDARMWHFFRHILTFVTPLRSVWNQTNLFLQVAKSEDGSTEVDGQCQHHYRHGQGRHDDDDDDASLWIINTDLR